MIPAIEPGVACSPADLGLPGSAKTLAQPGGEGHGRRLLASFLERRGLDYRRAMSAPLPAWRACSRLSAHLAFGCVSLRQVFQATRERQREVADLRAAGAPLDPRWGRSLASFQSRLRWHCHFMQKLEDEPSLEHRNLSRAYDGLRRREEDFNEERFAAWTEGRTGYPMVDACMRALHQGGWINFRMRAMLASFAAYHLWLPWQPCAVFLARHFLDYEPGIHYAQFQMQSGTTGINSVRIYSPAKQALDQDPRGAFIRRFVPELARVPTVFLAEPHRMPASVQIEAGCRVGHDYPAPVVEHAAAYRRARERMGAIRRTEHARAEARRVYARHGSRERPLAGRPGVARRPRRSSTSVEAGSTQAELDLCAA